MKAGDYIEFPAMFNRNHWMTAFVCTINDNGSINYVRDNLTVWSAGNALIERAKSITEEEYINRVKANASRSGVQIPTTENIKKVLEAYLSNLETEHDEICSILGIY